MIVVNRAFAKTRGENSLRCLEKTLIFGMLIGNQAVRDLSEFNPRSAAQRSATSTTQHLKEALFQV